MTKKKEQLFDVTLFKRLFKFIKPYKLTFTVVFISVIIIAGLGVATPYLLKYAIDEWQENVKE